VWLCAEGQGSTGVLCLSSETQLQTSPGKSPECWDNVRRASSFARRRRGRKRRRRSRKPKKKATARV